MAKLVRYSLRKAATYAVESRSGKVTVTLKFRR